MNIRHLLAFERPQSDPYEEVGPENMHAVEYNGHAEQIAILKANYVPLIRGGRLVYIDVGEDAEGEDDYSHVYPNRCHYHVHTAQDPRG